MRSHAIVNREWQMKVLSKNLCVPDTFIHACLHVWQHTHHRLTHTQTPHTHKEKYKEMPPSRPSLLHISASLPLATLSGSHIDKTQTLFYPSAETVTSDRVARIFTVCHKYDGTWHSTVHCPMRNVLLLVPILEVKLRHGPEMGKAKGLTLAGKCQYQNLN